MAFNTPDECVQVRVFLSFTGIKLHRLCVFPVYLSRKRRFHRELADIWDHQRSLRAFFQLDSSTSTETVNIKNALIPHKHIYHIRTHSLLTYAFRVSICRKCKIMRGSGLYWGLGGCKPRPHEKFLITLLRDPGCRSINPVTHIFLLSL